MCVRAHLWGRAENQWGREVWSDVQRVVGRRCAGEKATLAIFCAWHEEISFRNKSFCIPNTSIYSRVPVFFAHLNFRLAAVLFLLFCRRVVRMSPALWVTLTLEAMLGPQSSLVCVENCVPTFAQRAVGWSWVCKWGAACGVFRKEGNLFKPGPSVG